MPIPSIPHKVYPMILVISIVLHENNSVPRNNRCAPLTISIYPILVETTLKIIPKMAHDRKGMTGRNDLVSSRRTISGAVGRKIVITGHSISSDTTVC